MNEVCEDVPRDGVVEAKQPSMPKRMTKERYKELVNIAMEINDLLEERGINHINGEGCKVRQIAENIFYR